MCEFANVSNRAAQFFSLTGIFIALKPTFANCHYRPQAVSGASCSNVCVPMSALQKFYTLLNSVKYVRSLGSCRSTIELHPRGGRFYADYRRYSNHSVSTVFYSADATVEDCVLIVECVVPVFMSDYIRSIYSFILWMWYCQAGCYFEC